ncbi:MAG: NUMOD3 domain-containing DNA-binding protein, partial [Nanoarchaeota archaeon]
YDKHQIKLYNSLFKYGWENHIFEIVWAGDVNDMYKYETLIGWGFNVLEPENLNCKLPKLGDIWKVVSSETRKKMSNWQIGRKMSDEAKQKMSMAKRGKKHSEIQIKNHSRPNRKAIIQLDLQDNFIKEWRSAADASKELKINSGHISTCCRGERKTAGKFKWKIK